MKKTVLSIYAIMTIFSVYCQSGADKITFMSPSYSFSNVQIKGNNGSLYKAQSHSLALNLMRYTFKTNLFEASGGFGVHYLSSRFNDGRSSASVDYMGFAPEIQTKFFPLGSEKGIFIGTGAQFFVLPLNKTANVDIRSFRPMLTVGMTKKYGFTMFFVPTLLKGTVDDVVIEPSWYLGLELDIPWVK
jgi:hypothetical protein